MQETEGISPFARHASVLFFDVFLIMQEKRRNRSSMKSKSEYIDGFRKGIPIGLGYLPVSFTFGVMAVAGGIPVLLTIFTSVSNLTSA